MASIEKNNHCKTLISVISEFSIYTSKHNVIKKENRSKHQVSILRRPMIKLHYIYDEFAFFKITLPLK